ncbi:THUMP domain-containing protein 3 [Chamberlinius hualienensis]
MACVKIPDIGTESGAACTIEATVVTGLEFLAASECEQKLGATVLTSRGRIVFQVPFQDVSKVLTLKAIDNAFLIIFHNNNVEFPDDKDECLNNLSNIIPECHWEKGLKIVKELKNGILEEQELKFRVTCNRACGPLPGGKHAFNSPDVARFLGGIVHDKFNWKADMTKFDVEVVVNIVQSQVYVCFALTNESLHKRNIVDFGFTTLRSTIAYNLLQLADIKDGDVVCDPMCGSGAIPIEGALGWPKNMFLCGDFHQVPVTKTTNNKAHIENQNSKNLGLDIFRWDIAHLPLKSNSVDVFITDMPFGKRSGSKAINIELYPKILSEMGRVSNKDMGRAVLLTQDRKTMVRSLQKVFNLWKLVRVFPINLGGLSAGVYYLHRKTCEVALASGQLFRDIDPKQVPIMLNNEAFVRAQHRCIVASDAQAVTFCDRIGKRLRAHLGPAIQKADCPSSCTQKEKETIVMVISTIKRKYPDIWSDVIGHEGVTPEQITKLDSWIASVEGGAK